jgi:signal transduction histidine kinase
MNNLVSDGRQTLVVRDEPSALTAEAAERLVRLCFEGKEAESAALLLQDALTRVEAHCGALLYYPTHAPLAQLDALARSHMTEDEAQQVFLRYHQTGRHHLATRDERWFVVTLPCLLRDHLASHTLLLGWRDRSGGSAPSFRRVNARLAGSLDRYALVAEAITLMRMLAQKEVTSAAVERLRDAILTRVDHNLRTPLAAIQGHAWTLWRYYDKLPLDEQRDYLETIRVSSERLRATLDRMLQLAQLTSRTATMSKEPVSLVGIARSALLDVRASHSAPVNLALSAPALGETDDDELFRVEADPQWIRRVFDELLDNALRWGREGGSVSVQISPLTGEESVPAIECVVRDDGPGMSPEQLRHAFVPFPETDESLSAGYVSMGLGLAICKQVINQHDGAIWAESLLGQGTSVHFVLPCVHDPARASRRRYADENWRTEYAR